MLRVEAQFYSSHHQWYVLKVQITNLHSRSAYLSTVNAIQGKAKLIIPNPTKKHHLQSRSQTKNNTNLTRALTSHGADITTEVCQHPYLRTSKHILEQ